MYEYQFHSRQEVVDKKVLLPEWLDKYIFEDLHARYCRKYKDLVVLDWDRENILNYLGTYFPRSYAESYCIFSTYLSKTHEEYKLLDSLSIFDFGCGTGGEIIGLLIAIKQYLPHIKSIDLKAFDGNAYSLRILEKILQKFQSHINLEIASHIDSITIDDFYDMSVVANVITQHFDFIISFKAICEFVSKQQFSNKNPYMYMLNTFISKLSEVGIVCISDVTTYNDVSNEWLPRMLDKASNSCNVKIVGTNVGFNESYYVSHSKKTNDLSKIAWRIYKSKPI